METKVTEALRKQMGRSARTLVKGHPQIANLLAVSSAKGGVGKSTLAASLAVHYASQGLRVGLLDADIQGPSLPRLFGVDENMRASVRGSGEERRLKPLDVAGLRLMSMAFIARPGAGIVWRGPMVSGALRQLSEQTLWGELDIMLVDLPPGTGDIQITLCQHLPPTAAVVVTTGHPLSESDAMRGAEMLQRLRIPLMGVVENMSAWRCQHCGERSPVFVGDGGYQLARRLETELLTKLDMVPELLAPAPLASGKLPKILQEEFQILGNRIADRLGAFNERATRESPRIVTPPAETSG